MGNGITLDIAIIPGGSFLMGSPLGEEGRGKYEGPQQMVNVPDFAIGKFVVTQEQYEEIMGTNPARFKGSKHPVERVSWNDAVEFCEKLSEKTGQKYCLPSEAEWEYACRAGTTTPFYFGEMITTELAKHRKQTIEVGKFPPNAFGLYDMHGNVWEWCQDNWHDNYQDSPIDGSAWIDENNNPLRVLRGGSWDLTSVYFRSANRSKKDLNYRYDNIGFRVVLNRVVINAEQVVCKEI